MKINIKQTKIYVIFLIFFAGINPSLDSQNYQIKSSHFNQGGGISQSESYGLRDGFGNPSTVGKAESENYRVSCGIIILSETLTDLENNPIPGIPTTFKLYQNYPNPFNPVTTIRFQLPEKGKIIIQIFDVLGREIRKLVDGDYDAGWFEISFDGKDNSGKNLTSGLYIYKMTSEKYIEVKKLLFVK